MQLNEHVMKITYASVFQFVTDYQNASHTVPYERGVAPLEVLSNAHKYGGQIRLHIHRVHIRFTLCRVCPYMVIARTSDNLSHAQTTSLKKVEKMGLFSILVLSPSSYGCCIRPLAFLAC